MSQVDYQRQQLAAPVNYVASFQQDFEANQDLVSDLPPSNNELDNTSYIDRTNRYMHQDNASRNNLLKNPSIGGFSGFSNMTGMTGLQASNIAA